MQPEKIQLLLVGLIGTLLLLVLGALVVIFLLVFKARQRRNRLQQAELQRSYEQAILHVQLEVQNMTMQQIGEELHDNIGQLLSIARINLHIVEEAGIPSPQIVNIQQANELVGQSIHELRALTKSLDGDFVKDFGLQDSLAQELKRIRNTGRYKTEINVSGTSFSLGFQREIVLYRVVQELIQNTIKHAAATQITIQLNFEPDLFNLTLQDNGKGFDYLSIIQKPINQSGAGLRNIYRRINLIGGSCAFDSAVGHGTSVVISITNPTL
ncbi:sensor histidine kinase [Spirosoma pulveris]